MSEWSFKHDLEVHYILVNFKYINYFMQFGTQFLQIIKCNILILNGIILKSS